MGNNNNKITFPIKSFNDELSNLFISELLDILNDFYAPDLVVCSSEFIYHVNFKYNIIHKYYIDYRKIIMKNNIAIYADNDNTPHLLNLYTLSTKLLINVGYNKFCMNHDYMVIYGSKKIIIYGIDGNLIKILYDTLFNERIFIQGQYLICVTHDNFNSIIIYNIISNSYHYFGNGACSIYNHKIALANGSDIRLYNISSSSAIMTWRGIHHGNIDQIKITNKYLFYHKQGSIYRDYIDDNLDDMNYGTLQSFKFCEKVIIIITDDTIFIHNVDDLCLSISKPYGIVHIFDKSDNVALTDNLSYVKIINTSTLKITNYVLDGLFEKIAFVDNKLILYTKNKTIIVYGNEKIIINDVLIQ